MSVRKTHTQVLNKSLLPASVQQKSLGHRKGNQNWNKYYNDSQDPEILDSVAATISQVLFPTAAQTPQAPITNIVSTPNRNVTTPAVQTSQPNTAYAHVENGLIITKRKRGHDEVIVFELQPGTVAKLLLPGGVVVNLMD